MFKNVLVSVSDKSGLVDFIKPLYEQGARIVSTGGTAEHLQSQGVKVIQVSEQTGFPEVMGGRVKTLHPRVHMALLAREDSPEDAQILEREKIIPFDLVVVNLYPFETEPSVELMDIGGPAMLRAAAKNFSRIAVVCDPSDYKHILEQGNDLDVATRRRLAAKAFAHVSCYDSMISRWLGLGIDSNEWGLGGKQVSQLRYGENAQQKAQWLRDPLALNGLHKAQILQGKPLSYNNLLDLDAATRCLRDFQNEFACVAVKHTNPCGVACASSISAAVEKCIQADSKSIFGGIVALNKPIDPQSAHALSQIFLECIVAPDISAEAKKILGEKKNLRVLIWPDLMQLQNSLLMHTISGGFLVQEDDQVESAWQPNWTVIGQVPNDEQKQDLLFGWKVCANLKSNAIAIVAKSQTLGLGMGQVNRVDAVEHAIQRWKSQHSQIKSPVLASDAFFPFADSIELIAKTGIRYIIQPGGSIKDGEVFAAVKKNALGMVITGQRHFRH